MLKCISRQTINLAFLCKRPVVVKQVAQILLKRLKAKGQAAFAQTSITTKLSQTSSMMKILTSKALVGKNTKTSFTKTFAAK